MSRFY